MENIKTQFQILLNLFKTGNFIKAETLCKKLIKSYPKYGILYNIMGLIRNNEKRYEEAISYYNTGIEIQPNFAMLYNNLGSIYKIKQNYDKAESLYKKSISLDEKISEPLNNLGNLYKILDRYEDSIKYYKKSIDINSNFYISHYNLGIIYKTLGQFDLAKKFLKNSIKINPFLGFAHRSLSQITKYITEDEHIKLMLKIYPNEKIKDDQRKELAFALGKAYEDIKDFDNSYKYIYEGNNIQSKSIDFSYTSEKKEFNELKKIFTKSFFNKFNLQNQSIDDTAIFIVGMPRSGTTLVEQILSSHPEVFGGDELNFLTNLVIKNFGNKFSIKSFNKIIENEPDKLINIGKQYIKNLKELSKNTIKITDKHPINFKWIGLIKLILPKSKIIHCYRNSRDNCFSIYKNYFTNKQLNFAYNLNDISDYYILYHDLMNHWNETLPKFIHHISYEKLVLNPNLEIKSLLKSCDLPWNDKCLKFYENKRPIKTASDTQVRKKIYKGSINSWKNYEKKLKKVFNKLPT